MSKLEKGKTYRSKVTGTLHRCVEMIDEGRIGWFVELNKNGSTILSHKRLPNKMGFLAHRHLIRAFSCEEVILKQVSNVFCATCEFDGIHKNPNINIPRSTICEKSYAANMRIYSTLYVRKSIL